jgi:hypothetical protein
MQCSQTLTWKRSRAAEILTSKADISSRSFSVRRPFRLRKKPFDALDDRVVWVRMLSRAPVKTLRKEHFVEIDSGNIRATSSPNDVSKICSNTRQPVFSSFLNDVRNACQECSDSKPEFLVCCLVGFRALCAGDASHIASPTRTLAHVPEPFRISISPTRCQLPHARLTALTR